MLYMLKGKK